MKKILFILLFLFIAEIAIAEMSSKEIINLSKKAVIEKTINNAIGILKKELERLRVQFEVPPNAFGKEIFDRNLLVNSGFEIRNGATLADAVNWNQTENAYRQEWGQRMGIGGLMFQNWNGFTGTAYQAVSTNVPKGETVMLKFFAKANNDTRFDSGGKMSALIELKLNHLFIELVSSGSA